MIRPHSFPLGNFIFDFLPTNKNDNSFNRLLIIESKKNLPEEGKETKGLDEEDAEIRSVEKRTVHFTFC
jgi:hypothetical protein